MAASEIRLQKSIETACQVAGYEYESGTSWGSKVGAYVNNE